MTINKKAMFWILIGVLVVWSGFLGFKRWAATPEEVLVDVYDHGYSGQEAPAKALLASMEEMKQAHFSRPNVTRSYAPGVWTVYINYYLYAEKDGSVLDTKSFYGKLKISRSFKDGFKPKLAEVLEFKEIEYTPLK